MCFFFQDHCYCCTEFETGLPFYFLISLCLCLYLCRLAIGHPVAVFQSEYRVGEESENEVNWVKPEFLIYGSIQDQCVQVGDLAVVITEECAVTKLPSLPSLNWVFTAKVSQNRAKKLI